MKIFKRIAALSVVLTMVAIWFAFAWPVTPNSNLVRVSLLRINTSLTGSRSGVFQVESHMKEELLIQGGFSKVGGSGWVEQGLGSWGAMRSLLPGSTNIAELWLPQQPGSYRLMVYCYPRRLFAPQPGGLLVQIPRLVLHHAFTRWLPDRQQMKMQGVLFPTSDPFQVPQLDPDPSGESMKQSR